MDSPAGSDPSHPPFFIPGQELNTGNLRAFRRPLSEVRDGDTLQIGLAEVFHDSSHELGVDPGLQKDGVEAHLQALLAEHPEALAPGLSLIRRENPTPIGPVDLLCRDAAGAYVAATSSGASSRIRTQHPSGTMQRSAKADR